MENDFRKKTNPSPVKNRVSQPQKSNQTPKKLLKITPFPHLSVENLSKNVRKKFRDVFQPKNAFLKAF
jgi:hypothetical protein